MSFSNVPPPQRKCTDFLNCNVVLKFFIFKLIDDLSQTMRENEKVCVHFSGVS